MNLIIIEDTGKLIFGKVFTDDGTVWNGFAFEVFDAGRLSFYNISTIEKATGYFVLTIPAGISAGDYNCVFYDDSEIFLGSKPFNIPVASVVTTPSGAVNTLAYYKGQLTNIDAKIDAMIANPRPDYKVGDTSMAFGGLLTKLYDIREKIVNRINSMQGESFETITSDINPFGQDLADYINEGDSW